MIKRTKKEVLKLAKKEKVKFIRLWFTDILGFLKSFVKTLRLIYNCPEEAYF